MRRLHSSGGGRGRPRAAPRHSPHREGSSGVGRVDGSRVSSSDPPRPLEGGSGQTIGREGMTRAAGHRSRAAVAQTLLAGAGGGRGDGRGPGGGQRVGQVALPPHLPPKPGGLIDLGQRSKINDVIISMGAQVRRALASLIAVLQKDGSSSFIGGPAAFVVGPLPVNATAEARGLSKQGAAHRARLS